MGRVLRRVPLDFDWPIGTVWHGFLMPDDLRGGPCPDCEIGYAPDAHYFYRLWYGYASFHPVDTGCELLTAATPAVRAIAERNIARSPEYYGSDDDAVAREASRLAGLFNRRWKHHLTQDDVDALVEAGRLYEFTHTTSNGRGWEPIDPPVRPTAAEVNLWSLGGWGHDDISKNVVIKARCEREGLVYLCPTCEGNGSVEQYPGQSAAAKAWERTDPPAGEGWQLWETISEGSPKSPVFAASDALAGWMVENGEASSFAVAQAFMKTGWAPTAGTAGWNYYAGVEYIAATEDERE